MIALSPDLPKNLQQSRKAEGLGYTLYSDSAMNAARAFGIAFQLSKATVLQYRTFGIDLEAAAGRDHYQLPVPSVFLVEPGGQVGWVYSNPDYKVRPENDALLDAAKRLHGAR